MTIESFIESVQKLTSLEKHQLVSALFEGYSFKDNVQICCCVSCGKLGGCVKGYLQGVGTETWYNSHFITGLNGNQVCDGCVEKKMQEDVKKEIIREMEKQDLEEEYESEEEYDTEYSEYEDEDSEYEEEIEESKPEKTREKKDCDIGDEKTECLCCGEEIEEEGCSCETSRESEGCYASECEDCGECRCCCCDCGKEKKETPKEKKDPETQGNDKLRITVEKNIEKAKDVQNLKNTQDQIIAKKLVKKAKEVIGYNPHKELSNSAKIWTILRNAGKLSGYIASFNNDTLKTLENCKKCKENDPKGIYNICNRHAMSARLEVIYCEIEEFIGELQSTINSRENVKKEIKGINDCVKSLANQVERVFEDFPEFW